MIRDFAICQKLIYDFGSTTSWISLQFALYFFCKMFELEMYRKINGILNQAVVINIEQVSAI